MKVVIFGATGMVGGEVLDRCLNSSDIENVVAIGRRPTDTRHPKLRQIRHLDFLDFSSLSDELSDIELCFYCVGVYQGSVSKSQFLEITVDYLQALLSTLEKVNSKIGFHLFSAQGADRRGKSPFLFTRAKGQAENLLSDSGIERWCIYRPGYINPSTAPRTFMMSNRIYKLLYLLFPMLGIDAPDLAKVMVNAALKGETGIMFKNRDIRAAAKLNSPS